MITTEGEFINKIGMCKLTYNDIALLDKYVINSELKTTYEDMLD